jgi:hypothetical protein
VGSNTWIVFFVVFFFVGLAQFAHQRREGRYAAGRGGMQRGGEVCSREVLASK